MTVAKTYLVTGATSGIGYVTARDIAKQGATVVLVGRNNSKGHQAVRNIAKATGNDAVFFLKADLSSQEEVRHLAEQFKEKHTLLHGLVNNAGAIYKTQQESADGVELTFALNHLAYFLLTGLLLESLKRSALEHGASARVVNVASAQHKHGNIDFSNLHARQAYDGWRAYRQSKLANVLFTYELSRRLQGTGVSANALHPGVVATGFDANNQPALSHLTKTGLRRLLGKSISAETGAQTSVYLATSPAVEGVTGRYFVDKEAVRSSEASYDPSLAKKLWEVSEALTGLDKPHSEPPVNRSGQ